MARYDLTSMVARQGNRQRIITLRGIEITNALTKRLERINRRVMDPWNRRADEIKAIYRAEYQRRIQLDRTDPLSGLFAQLTIEVNRLLDDIEVDAEDFAAATEAWHRDKWQRAVLTGTGINLGTLIGPAEAQETIGDFIARNTALVRNVSDETRRKIADLVYRGLQERLTPTEVGREISRQLGISRRRANRIAQDQANKLNGALDRQRQREAGIEFWKWRHSGKRHFRPEHKARDGKIYTDQNAPTDLPGQLPFCGCVREAVIITDEAEAERIRNRKRGEAAPRPVQQPPTPDPTPEPPAPDPEPAGAFRSPINPDVTSESFNVVKRLAAQAQMQAVVEKAALAGPYQIDMEFRGRERKHRGQAKLGTGFTNEAASAVAAIAPELDNLADQIGIPRLRGYLTLPKKNRAGANMGDGIMGLNPWTFNNYAEIALASRKGANTAELIATRKAAYEALEGQRSAITQQANALYEQMKEARAAGDLARFGILKEQRAPLLAEHKKVDSKVRAAWEEWKRAERAGQKAAEAASDWTIGGSVKNRPHGSDAYFSDGLDKVRSLMYHEFGHHIHQYLGKQGHRRRVGDPPLEREIPLIFRRLRKEDIATGYGTTKPQEWFAESFALYAMGRADLVVPEFRDLMERIFNGSYLRDLG